MSQHEEPYIYGIFTIRKCDDTDCDLFNERSENTHWHATGNGISFVCTNQEHVEMIALTQSMMAVLGTNERKLFESLMKFTKEHFSYGITYREWMKREAKNMTLKDIGNLKIVDSNG